MYDAGSVWLKAAIVHVHFWVRKIQFGSSYLWWKFMWILFLDDVDGMRFLTPYPYVSFLLKLTRVAALCSGNSCHSTSNVIFWVKPKFHLDPVIVSVLSLGMAKGWCLGKRRRIEQMYSNCSLQYFSDQQWFPADGFIELEMILYVQLLF